jgi:hypothetical protein
MGGSQLLPTRRRPHIEAPRPGAILAIDAPLYVPHAIGRHAGPHSKGAVERIRLIKAEQK